MHPEEVRDAYDARVDAYTAVSRDDLDRVPRDRHWLRAFAREVAPGPGRVADLGCGPGHIVDHLAGLGVEAIGYDLSPAMIREARRAFPGSEFRVGDLTSLGLPEGSVAGIVARYSLIHLPPARLPQAFAGWARIARPGAPILVSFFAASSPASHGRPFDHAVTTAHELCPQTLVAELRDAGFVGFQVGTRRPLDGERPLDHGTILARLAPEGPGRDEKARGRS